MNFNSYHSTMNTYRFLLLLYQSLGFDCHLIIHLWAWILWQIFQSLGCFFVNFLLTFKILHFFATWLSFLSSLATIFPSFFFSQSFIALPKSCSRITSYAWSPFTLKQWRCHDGRTKTNLFPRLMILCAINIGQNILEWCLNISLRGTKIQNLNNRRTSPARIQDCELHSQ